MSCRMGTIWMFDTKITGAQQKAKISHTHAHLCMLVCMCTHTHTRDMQTHLYFLLEDENKLPKLKKKASTLFFISIFPSLTALMWS